MSSPTMPLLSFDLEAHLSQPLAAYLDRNDEASFTPLVACLTPLVLKLARDADYRHELASSPSSIDYLLTQLVPSIWNNFLKNANATGPQTVEQKQVEQSSTVPKEQYDARYRDIQLLLLALRASRNAMAHSPTAQDAVASKLDSLQPMMAHITSFAALTDTDLIPLSRTAAQLLCNLVTANPKTQDQAWNRIVLAPSSEQQLVHRLLTSPDTATQMAVQVLVINLLKTDDLAIQHVRCRELASSIPGVKVIEALLGLADSIVLQTPSHPDDEPDKTSPEQHQQLEESLRLINAIFSLLFSNGMASTLLTTLAPVETISSDAAQRLAQPIVTSSQLTLLKLLDSLLHFHLSAPPPSTLESNQKELAFSPHSDDLGGLEGLIDVFLDLSSFVRSAMQAGLKDPEKQDKRVVGVHQVLLLILQCLLSLGLKADGDSSTVTTSSHEPLGAESKPAKGFAALSRRFLATLRTRIEVVDELVLLLHQTALFTPALSPFAFASASAAAAVAAATDLPEGHVLSSTGAASLSTASVAGAAQTQQYGFDHLKRDIVRVIGALVYNPATIAGAARDGTTSRHVRTVQDRVRDKGGLFDVLNMTVLDERNPYMREHAIFTLRYLLAGNLESQELVKQLEPLEQRQPDGVNGGAGGDGRGGMASAAGLQLPLS